MIILPFSIYRDNIFYTTNQDINPNIFSIKDVLVIIRLLVNFLLKKFVFYVNK